MLNGVKTYSNVYDKACILMFFEMCFCTVFEVQNAYRIFFIAPV